METIAERAKHARKESGLTQPALAKKVGVSKAAISQLENGVTKDVRQETLFGISDATGFSPRWLSTGRGPMKADAEVEILDSELPIPLPSIEEIKLFTIGKFNLEDSSDSISSLIKPQPRTFAFNVVSGSCEPKLARGSQVLISPGSPVRTGDYGLYIVGDSVVLALSAGAHIEYTSSLGGSPPAGKPVEVGRVALILPVVM